MLRNKLKTEKELVESPKLKVPLLFQSEDRKLNEDIVVKTNNSDLINETQLKISSYEHTNKIIDQKQVIIDHFQTFVQNLVPLADCVEIYCLVYRERYHQFAFIYRENQNTQNFILTQLVNQKMILFYIVQLCDHFDIPILSMSFLNEIMNELKVKLALNIQFHKKPVQLKLNHSRSCKMNKNQSVLLENGLEILL
jgi:hypothetical protein